MRAFRMLEDFFRRQIVGEVPAELVVCEFNCRNERCDSPRGGCMLRRGHWLQPQEPRPTA